MPKKELKTIINLEHSTYAHEFAGEELIHKKEFARVIELVSKQLVEVGQRGRETGKRLTHFYNTISVFGERGTGKTSFLHSVISNIEIEHSADIEILGFIDPTIIEEKEHIFLLVISLIDNLVKERLKENECMIRTQSFQQRSLWQKHLLRLAKGIPTLEKVGEDRKNSNWQSHDFIMEQGLGIVYSAFNLEKEFRDLVSCALEILGKKAFVLALDDIDVDMKKGWDVLEMLRKYITTPQVITILSGNLKLYSLNVRKHQWEQLEKNIELEPGKDYLKTVNELEGQYLLKVLKSENRIHLYSILEAIELFNAQFDVELSDGTKKDIISTYTDILARFGIKNVSQCWVFARYLLGLSVRSQIQFILNNQTDSKFGLDSVEAFLSRLYAANVDVNIAVNNAQMLSLIIQRYIEQQESTPDLYLLMPNYPHEDVNACLTAFTILFAKEVKKSNFLIFDYLVRIGYTRNLLLGLDEYYVRDGFYSHVGLTQNMSLKNCVGLSIGYCMVYESQLESHIALLALAGKNKQNKTWSQGHIDYEIEEKANHAQSIIAYLPISVMKYTDKNESRVYYSFYNLLATIAEILKAPKDNIQVETVKSLLMSLQLLRTYPAWKKEGDMQTKYVEEEDNTTYSEELMKDRREGDETLNELAENVVVWRKEFNESIPPYLLGRIATRLYYTLQKIHEGNLGDQMHRSVIAFFNACLIEEVTEYYVKSDNNEGIERVNLSNVITEDKVFLNNLAFIRRNNARNAVKMTEWIVRCPLLWAFTDPNVIITTNNSKINVYHILQMVKIKNAIDKNKPEFSADKSKIGKTIEVLKSYGYDINSITDMNKSTETIITELERSGIFRNKPQKTQITAFRRNYKPVGDGITYSTNEDIDEMFNDNR